MLRRMWLTNPMGYESQPYPDKPMYFNYNRLTFFIGKNNSGKSRFLRCLFEEWNKHNRDGILDFVELKWLYSISDDEADDVINFIGSKDNKGLHIKSIKNIGFPASKDSLGRLTPLRVDIIDLLKDYNRLGQRFGSSTERIRKDMADAESYFDQDINDVFYVPILRGLRPLTKESDQQSYLERTKADYFPSVRSVRQNLQDTLVTGECFYYLIKAALLGEPEERELMKKYEEVLSDYFFDRQKVTLIPKHNSDVLHIKIGADAQRPIYELGDGLQQVIILTYQAFMSKEKICAFFIEEPELHMHAGMLRQLMNFYLNKTKHYYFFTTHSNHLLDMVDESDEVVIQKFTKKKKEDGVDCFEIKRCDKDRELLAALGVRPSSVYLANCTIWVEGITDRLYLTKYMQKYLHDLQKKEYEKFIQYRRFMPNFHYTFVEYQGSNLTHWNFDEEDQNFLEDNGLHAPSLCADMLLIADGDIKSKGSRVEDLKKSLRKDQFILLTCKETENTLPPKLLFELAVEKFGAMKTTTKDGFDGAKLQQQIDSRAVDIFQESEEGVGLILDNIMRNDPPIEVNNKLKRAFADESGTVKDKLKFCRSMLAKMDELDAWELTDTATSICEQIFEFIEKRNQEIVGATSHAS